MKCSLDDMYARALVGVSFDHRAVYDGRIMLACVEGDETVVNRDIIGNLSDVYVYRPLLEPGEEAPEDDLSEWMDATEIMLLNTDFDFISFYIGFAPAIDGVTDDGRIVYDYDKMVEVQMKMDSGELIDWFNEDPDGRNDNVPDDPDDDPQDPYLVAREHVDYGIVKPLEHENGYGPIVYHRLKDLNRR